MKNENKKTVKTPNGQQVPRFPYGIKSVYKEEEMTHDFVKKYLKITEKHTGKMKNIQSLNTDCTINPNCLKYCKIDGSICQKCFAQNMHKMYGPAFNYFINTEILTAGVLDKEDLPFIYALYFRIEAFGDLNNEIQLINYFNICKKNPRVNFALWSKNPQIIKKVIEEYGYKKPKNLNIILSSLFINKEINIDSFDWADKVFTVYDKNYIKENDIEINCGARSCATCLKCYKKNKIKIINEKLK